MVHWYKHDPDAFITGTTGLTLEEVGAYALIIDMAYARDGEVPDDDHYLATLCRCHWRTIRAIKESLVAKGKLRLEGGKIIPRRVQEALKEAAEFSQKQSRIAKKRWESTVVSMPRGNASTSTSTSTLKKDGAHAPLPDKNTAEKELFDRGKAILGQNAGGLIRKVLKAKGENVALARAAIEQASTKQSPLEYAGRIAAGPSDSTPPSIEEREKQPGFYARLESPEQQAWEKFRGKSVRDRDGGWLYPARWPPDAET